MKRDWDVIREVLLEVEEGGVKTYNEREGPRGAHAILLHSAGYLSGGSANSYDGKLVFSPQLTWAGHDLLDTLRSKPVWEKIKSLAVEKGVELTFDAVKALGAIAVGMVVRG